MRLVAAGDNYTVAVTHNNKMYSWGQGNDGQLGHGTTDDIMVPKIVMHFTQETGKFLSISCGKNHTAAIV